MRKPLIGIAALALGVGVLGACGGRSELAGSSEGATGPASPGDSDEPSDDFRVIAQPALVAPNVFLETVVARSGEFDLVGRAERDGSLGDWWAARLAWGASLSATSATVVRSDHGSRPGLGVRDDQLIVCGPSSNGFPIDVVTLRGLFIEEGSKTIPGNSAACHGAAYLGDRGILGVHRPPPQGCCSRPMIYDPNNLGDEPRDALPDGEFGYISTTTTASDFVWAGLTGDDDVIHVTFSPDGDLRQTHEFDVAQGESYRPPGLAGHATLDAVLISHRHTNKGASMFAVSSGGALVFEREFDTNTDLDGLPWPRRVAVATTQGAWLAAWTECNGEAQGRVVVERLDLTGSGERLSFPVSCPTNVTSVAAAGRRAVVTWSTDAGVMAAGLEVPP